jgi:SOS-response transcriptional repressor LexA
MKLSRRQQDVIQAVESFISTHNYSPTVREIGKLLGWSSPSTAHGMLQRLRDKGAISWQPDTSRTIKVLKV